MAMMSFISEDGSSYLIRRCGIGRMFDSEITEHIRFYKWRQDFKYLNGSFLQLIPKIADESVKSQFGGRIDRRPGCSAIDQACGHIDQGNSRPLPEVRKQPQRKFNRHIQVGHEFLFNRVEIK